MKIFRDIFLEGGIGFDVQKLFSANLDNQQSVQYVWFA